MKKGRDGKGKEKWVRRPPNPHTREGKDARDRGRAWKALERGLDLGKVLWVALGEGKEGARADAALRRLQRALKNRQLGVGWRSHLDEALLKHLVGEGYLRPEKREVPKHVRSSWKGDERFAPWVSYRITEKGKKLLEALQEKQAGEARAVSAGGGGNG